MEVSLNHFEFYTGCSVVFNPKKITKNSNFNVFISTLVCIRTNLKCTENLYKKPKRLKIKKQTNISNVVLL